MIYGINMMHKLSVTQYLRPHGTKRKINKEVSDDVYAKGLEIIEAGYALEAEVLTTGEVSFTIADYANGVDVAIELSPNGPEVDDAFNRMILNFNIKQG